MHDCHYKCLIVNIQVEKFSPFTFRVGGTGHWRFRESRLEAETRPRLCYNQSNKSEGDMEV